MLLNAPHPGTVTMRIRIRVFWHKNTDEPTTSTAYAYAAKLLAKWTKSTDDAFTPYL